MAVDYLAVLLAALIFAFVTIVHIVRLFKPFKIVIADCEMPQWASIVFAIVGAYISIFLFLLL